MHHRNLEHRLKQRGRRSGIIIGVSIAAAMTLGMVTFVLIYAVIDPLTTDFISKHGADVSRPALDPPLPTEAIDPTDVSTSARDGEAVPTSVAEVGMLGSSGATAEASSFLPDYRVVPADGVNLRLSPGVSSAVVVVVPAGGALEYLNDSRVTANPQQDGLPMGGRWLKFRTAAGDEGWIREVDVTSADA
jgi:hypothetical protein